MIVLVTGGRDYADAAAVDTALSHIESKISLLVEGGARGADRLAQTWAKKHCIHVATIEALWDAWPKHAGPIRNTAMLVLPIALCIAFPGGNGTQDMIAKCRAKNIPVWEPYP